MVAGKGLATPALASGAGAARVVRQLAPLGMPVQSVGDEPGQAASRKLLRSIFMKGLAGVAIEAMRGAEAAGVSEWLWEELASELAAADESLIVKLFRGTVEHAARRVPEMEASQALLEELGLEPVMTRATVQHLRDVPARGVPEAPPKRR